MIRSVLRSAAATCAMACALSAVPALAEGADVPSVTAGEPGGQAGVAAAALASDQTIIVTGKRDGYVTIESRSATKTDTPLLDVPQSIAIVGEEQIEDQQLRDIGDVLRYTAGATIGQGEGNRDQITIRGQNTTADFFIDGLRDDVQYFRPLYNLERVEILKGSNAMIFGRGGGGGVVNRVTKSPEAGRFFASATGSVDSFGSVYFAGDLNISAGETAGFRLNAFYEHLDNHRDFFDGDRFAINPTFAAELSPGTRVLVSYEYVDDDRVTDRGVPNPGNGTLGAPVGPVSGFRDTFFGDPDANVTTLKAHILRGRFEHDFSEELRFDTSVQYADYDKLYQNLYPVGINLTAGTVSLDGYSDPTDRQNFVIQSNLVWDFATGPIDHTLLVGMEYGSQKSDNSRLDVRFAANNSDVITFPFSDPLNIPAFSFPNLVRDTSSDVEFFSLYAQDQIAIGEHVLIVGGLRYDRFEIDVIDRIEVADGAADGNDGLLGRVDNEISPRIGVIVKPQANLSLYASYALSFLPRSGDQFVSLTPSAEALEPEEFKNYEIGVKWDIRPDLSLTAAAFRLDRENGTTADPNNPGSSILTGTRTEGFELQLAGQLTPWWQISAGYSYIDGQERGRVANGVILNRVLSQVPENTAYIWNRFDVTDRLGFGLGATYQDEQFASISNSVLVPDFIRVDAAIFFQATDRLRLQLNVENLFDETYFPAAHNDVNISTGEPFNARFSVIAKF